MLEQETASIIKFVLTQTNNSTAYYENIPESFAVPSVYFPIPEITTRAETFNTYAFNYDWYIHFFHKTTQEAYSLALYVLTAIVVYRNLIPLVDIDGAFSGEYLRISDIKLVKSDEGVVQLQINWDSRRPYQNSI